MAINDINQNFKEYREIDKLRVFLYTPSNELVRELETINPVLHLRKTGFHTFDFGLPAKIFDIGTLTHTANPAIDDTLDGYEIEVWVGDTTKQNTYDEYRFIIAARPSSMSEEKPVFNYSCFSSELELKKLPIISWPGIEVVAYKQTTSLYNSLTQTGNPLISPPKLMDGTTGYLPIQLVKAPKANTIIVTRAHRDYGVEERLFPTISSDGSSINEDEYFLYESSGTWYIKAYVPGNIKLPINNSGQVRFNDPVDQYKYYIYYETDSSVAVEDLSATFERAPYFKKDGLTINEVVEDLFNNLEARKSRTRHFLGWSYDKENSDTIEAIRSGLSFDNTTLHDILQSLAENYQVYMDYNTVSRSVIIRNIDFGSNNGLRFEYGKYLKGVTQEINTDNQVNYVQGQDANNIGFADISWSGDNYVENYNYFLDGVTHNGTSVIGLPSRWLSNGLATELALRKYYQNFYQEEVWGGNGKIGIANMRFNLQEQITNKKFELEEIQVKIQRFDDLLESYYNETDPQIIQNLDVSSRETSYLVPKKLEDLTSKTTVNYTLTPNTVGSIDLGTIGINLSSSIYAKAFAIFGSPDQFFSYQGLNGTEQIPLDQVYNSFIDIQFKNNGQTVHSVTDLKLQDFNKEILLKDNIYLIDEIVITGVILVSEDRTFFTYTPIKIDSFEIYQYETENPIEVQSWTDYAERQEYLKELAEIKKNEKEREINLLLLGVQKPDGTNIFNKEIAINEVNTYGLYQLEERLRHIRTFTAVNHAGLTDEQRTELKRIRRGAVYQNTDIVDSKSLFQASETHLSENIDPSITITIDSISIFQAYEAESDWSKVKIGEKVDIYVPDLKIDVEAEIQEISIDFQNYGMGIVIATARNYDKTFGKFFADVYKLLTVSVINEQRPNQSKVRKAITFEEDFADIVDGQTDGSEQIIGSRPQDNPSQTKNRPNRVTFNEIFIDPRIDDLVSTPPTWPDDNNGTFELYQGTVPGYVTLASGGIYIKDQNDNLRIKMTARDGLVAQQFQINLQGNATFAGQLQAASGTFAGELSAATGTFTGDLSAAGGTFAGELSAATGTFSGTLSAGVALTDTTLSNQLASINTIIGSLESQIDNEISTWFYNGVPTLENAPALAWTTNEIKNAHLGDLYYDGETGLAYRFVYEDIVDDDPDLGVVYYWNLISDTAITAALAAASTAQATADGKMTYFTANTLAQVIGLDAQQGDILIPSVDITDGQTEEPSILYFKDTVYTYTLISTGPDVFEWLPEEKKAGTVGGWSITSTQIKSTSNSIILDNQNETITVGLSGAGQVILDGSAKGTEAVIHHAEFQLKADGSAVFSGDLEAASGSFGSVFIDPDGSLIIDKIRIDNSGIKATVVEGDEVAESVVKFNLDSSTGLLTATDATITGAITATSGSFTGSITSESGSIGGWSLSEDRLIKTFDNDDNPVNIYAGSSPDAVAALSQGSYGFIVENTNPSETQPFVTAITNNGFFIFSQDSYPEGEQPVPVMEIQYDDSSIWARGLVISDNKNVLNSNVVIGQLGAAGNGYGIAVNSGEALTGSRIKIDYDGINIEKRVNNISIDTFKADIDGNVSIIGDINATSGTFNNTITVGTNDSKISISGTNQANTTAIHSHEGVFGDPDTGFYFDASGRFSLGDKLKIEDGSLELEGDIGGTIGKISVEGDTGLIEITEDGVFGYQDKNNVSVKSFELTKEGQLSLQGDIIATGGDIAGWKIEKAVSGSSGIYSGNRFLSNASFGAEGELTISSDGYISGPNFNINSSGGAIFNNFRARGVVDLADIKRELTTLSVSDDVISTVVLNSNNCQFGECRTLLRTINITSRDMDFITISKLIDVSDIIVPGITYLINFVTAPWSIGIAGGIDNDTIFNFDSTLKSITAITITIEHASTDAGKTVKIRNHIKSSTMSKLRITNIDDVAIPETSDSILMIDQNQGETVRRGPVFNTSTNSRTKFLRNDGTWETPAIFGTTTANITATGGTINGDYSSFYRIPVSSSGVNGVYMYIFTGFITVISGTGTATVTLPVSLTRGAVQATVASNNSSGSGGDLIYALMSSVSTNQFTITKDFATSNNSNAVHFTVIGHSTTIYPS